MHRLTFTILTAAFLAGTASAQEQPKAKKAHPNPLAYYLSSAESAADEAAIKASLQKVKSVSAIDFNAKAGYVRVVFDSHIVSYHQVAQAIADAGSKTGKKYDPRLKMRIPEYPLKDNAAKVDALLAGKRLNQRVRIEAVDKTTGDFVIRFLSLQIDPAETAPQGFNGGHINHPIHDAPPRGLGLTCIYATEQAPAKTEIKLQPMLHNQPVVERDRLDFVQIKRVGSARLKTSLNAYSFNKTLNDQLKGRGKGMSLFDLLDYCAEQNFDAIDPTGYFFPGYPKPPSEKFLNDFKRRAFVLGLGISGTGVRNDFATADKSKRAADVKHVKEWIEVAARMGAPVLRVFAGKQPEGYEWDEVAKWMVEDLKECVEHGKKHGVIIGIQNHWDFLKTGEQTVKLVKMVDSEWFGVIVDTGYFLTPDPYKDIAMVAPYAVNWQVKQHIGGKGAKAGDTSDLRKIVKIARDSGYRGYLPIETLPVLGEDYNPRTRVAQCLE